ncbi:type IV secretion system protein [Novosphingobium piscinae]|uniref:Type IV secretion system protein n=1 Tax=Novosphingobium piscinae TaxID=1507448 RepID=A0A7X1KR32_9SPHN|nr:type IV secretion system protein [Novosphingobium piscinae]MBC2670198.1 type IV secretion system protein [Novosphingobium piscinae]
MATQAAFTRLFGGDGQLTVALSLALTLYVALFALRLLTGQGRLGLAALTPRMMGLGLALTFATSWVAYSTVIWSLLAAGPDWIAASLLGIRGSATEAFAVRLDGLFAAVASAAEQAQVAVGEAKGTTPADLLSYAALLLLLGTVGVLVTSRIALATLLALGPIFLILAIFPGTRGLFAGWVRTAVLFALAPMFATLIGVGSVAMLDPVVAGLEGGDIGLAQAAAVFVAAAVHCMLMALALKLVGALTAGWNPAPGQAEGLWPAHRAGTADLTIAAPGQPWPGAAAIQPPAPGADSRYRDITAAVGRVGLPGSAETMPNVIRLPGLPFTTLPPLAPVRPVTASRRPALGPRRPAPKPVSPAKEPLK